MLRFLVKGIMRDASRSRLPVIIVAVGVFLTVFLSAWINGILGDMIDLNARFTTGHVKVMTKAYAENAAQLPNDLALLGVNQLKTELEQTYPDLEWVERIRFGGLIDVPDENGETKIQGPAAGQAMDLLSANTKEPERLNIEKAIQRGRLPRRSGEALLSEDFARKLNLALGDEITLFGSTMEGSMAFQNFRAVGTVSFGATMLDRGAVLIDIRDAQQALDMEDAAGEVLGYFKSGQYDDEKARQIAAGFNAQQARDTDEFAPIMLRLKEQNSLESMLDYSEYMSFIMVGIFVLAMSIVLWNTGLLGGLRRYAEFGLRLALGESKSHIFRSMIYESVVIGFIGSVIGTGVGVALSYYLQVNGIDFSGLMQNSTMMIPQVYRAVVTPETYYLGFIPGLFSMVLGTALAGIGIFQRQTAQLFKELEV